MVTSAEIRGKQRDKVKWREAGEEASGEYMKCKKETRREKRRRGMRGNEEEGQEVRD